MGLDSSKNKIQTNAVEGKSRLTKIENEHFIGKVNKDPEQDYKRLEFLGEGRQATVYMVQNNLSGVNYAMKILKKTNNCSEKDNNKLFKEIVVLRKINHPNIVKIYEFYSNNDSFKIILELCPYGDLFQKIMDKGGPFDEKTSGYIIYQILSAVYYCHQEGIIHGNIIPENILISRKDANDLPLLKLGGFGTAKFFDEDKVENKKLGNHYYLAPEVIKGDYNEKCDLWSCGVLLYVLLSWNAPFLGNNKEEIKKKILIGKYDLAPINKCSSEVKDLIRKLLKIDPSKRLSAEEAINHSWMKKIKAKEFNNEIKDSQLVDEFIENLIKYKSDSIIQETALAYLVNNFPERPDIQNATKLFKQMDVSGDGKISKDEFYQWLKKKSKRKTLEKDVDIIFKNLDGDLDGYLQMNEFIRGAISKKKFLKKNILKIAFDYFDKDKNGEISYDEIEEVFVEDVKDRAKMKTTLRAIIAEVDTDQDGKISYQEFEDIMKKFLN